MSTWTNSSASSVEITSSSTASCTYECTVQGGSFDYAWYPSIFTRTVATESVIIWISNGHRSTATSTLTADERTANFSGPTSLGAFGSYINATTFLADEEVTMFVFTPETHPLRLLPIACQYVSHAIQNRGRRGCLPNLPYHQGWSARLHDNNKRGPFAWFCACRNDRRCPCAP